jgi:tetratricopeptide (TPR) repeat protein
MRFPALPVFLVFCAAPALAQSPVASPAPSPSPAARRHENLKVLPADIGHDDLIQAMGGFTRALGVRCVFCHAAANGQRPSAEEFKLDTNEHKDIARAMLRMTDDINKRQLPLLGKDPARLQKVSCTTCHGGLKEPRPLEAVIVRSYQKDGLDAATKKYRELRQEYYGQRAYDFSDVTLVSAADELGETDKDIPAALALMKLNLEFNPQSWFTYQEMGQLQERAGDTAGAMASYRKAIEIEPSRGASKERLEELQVKLELQKK